MPSSPARAQSLDYVVVLDFEATCDERNPPVPQEIIEFPSVLVALPAAEPVGEFASIVRPHHHPRLTAFCTELTGTTQDQVDAAPAFADALELHLDWLRSHRLPVTPGHDDPRWAFATCGDWDLGIMLPHQCSVCQPALETIPWPYRQWINIKRPFAQLRGLKKAPGMAGMLRQLDLELTGRHHCGIDDCRNIAKIVRAFVQAGLTLEITTELPASRYPPIELRLSWAGTTRDYELESRSLKVLLGRASGLFCRQMTRAFHANGRELTSEADLLDLPRYTVIIVTDGGEPTSREIAAG